MAHRRRSTAVQGRDAPAATLRSRRRSQWNDSTDQRKITPTFMLWCVSCVLLILSAAMHFSNKSKSAVVPVLKHDQAQCAEECWVRESIVYGCGANFGGLFLNLSTRSTLSAPHSPRRCWGLSLCLSIWEKC